MARNLFCIGVTLNRRPRLIAFFVLIAATFLVYWPALRNGFVWDDTALVLRDPLIRSWRLIGEGFQHFLFLDATASNFYRPLQRLTYIVDYQLYGFDCPAGWHLTNILIHACAALALYCLIEKLCGQRGAGASPAADADLFAYGARQAAERHSAGRGPVPSGPWRLPLLVSLIWVIHPLHTSAVTYVSGRADPLAALFGFTALTLALSTLERRSWVRMLGAACGLLLALLSKEGGIASTLILLLLLAGKRVPWRVASQWIAIAALVLGSYAALRFTAEKVAPPEPSPTPLATRPILFARAWAGYAGLLIAPVHLHMERDVTTRPEENLGDTLRHARQLEYQTLAGVVLVTAFGIWWWRIRRSEPIAALSLGAFTVAYLLISSLKMLNATMAEHWLYVPSAFLFLAAALSLRGQFFSAEAPCVPSLFFKRAAATALVIWMSFLGVRTMLRHADWHDQRTFFERTIAAGGDTARMRMNLGNVELAESHQERAAAQYREAIRRGPDKPMIWLGYAAVAIRGRDYAAAEEALERAERSPLLTAECHQLRAALNNVASGEDSGDTLRDAIDFAPDNWSIHKHYIGYLSQRGDEEEALRELRSSLEAQPFRAESWSLLGRVLELMHKPALAVAAYREAAERDVRDTASRASVVRLLARK